MAHPLLFDCTWTQQWKYESAEAYYQQVLAGTGGAVPVSQGSQQAQGSTLKSEIAQARQNIQKALNNDSSGKSSGGAVDQQVLNRIQSLETENKNLKKSAEDLAALVKKLESRVAALETSGSGSAAPSSSAPAQPSKKEDSDSDFDPFGDDDDDDSEDEETKARVAAYNAKKAKKPVVVAKSNLILDVKPWDDETDMVETEKLVRSIEMDGLLWGAAKLVPVGYGIKKLQISAVIEDAKVSTDDLDEKITAFEDHETVLRVTSLIVQKSLPPHNPREVVFVAFKVWIL